MLSMIDFVQREEQAMEIRVTTAAGRALVSLRGLPDDLNILVQALLKGVSRLVVRDREYVTFSLTQTPFKGRTMRYCSDEQGRWLLGCYRCAPACLRVS